MHILCVFWAFVLMALHLGLHWNMILGMIRKACGPVSSKPAKAVLRAEGAVIAVYGLYAFVKNQFLSYMFLTAHFVFFDFERPLPLFFTEYICHYGIVCILGSLWSKGIQTCTARRRKQQQDEK